MANFFKFDSAGVKTIMKNCETKKEKYNSDIEELKKLIDEINTSASWKDEKIKTEFIMQMNSYVKKYEDYILKMNRYLKYLNKKTSDVIDMEYNYSRKN